MGFQAVHHAKRVSTYTLILITVIEPLSKLFIFIFSEFWVCEIDRAVGEVGFFLEQKSKFIQFQKMLADPLGNKFKVKSYEDIEVNIFRNFSIKGIFEIDN